MSSSEHQSSEVAALIAPSVGNEKACELVDAAVASLGLDATALNVDSVLAVLEAIAQEPGVVGIAARFAKSRVHLQWAMR